MTRDEYDLVRDDMALLREEVLSRIRTVRKIKAFFASPVSSASFVVVCLLCASIFVSFSDILTNVMVHNEWSNRLSYTYSSLMHARIMVQILAVLTGLCCLILGFKILMRLRSPVYFVGNFINSHLILKIFRP